MALRAMQRLSSLSNLGQVARGTCPIAIDLGASAMKILQIGPGEPATLIGAACVETPSDLVDQPAKRLAFQLDALPSALRRAAFKGRRAVCGIPADQTVSKPLEFEKGGPNLASLARSTLASQIGRDADSLVLRHYELAGASKPGKTEVLALGVGREVVERLMEGMRAAKLEAVGLHCEFPALLRAFDYLNRRGTDEATDTLYLDLGAMTTKVVIARGQEMVFARCVPFGGRSLDEAVHKRTGCGLSRARERRLATTDLVPAGEATSPGALNLGESLEVLTDEIQMCLRYHESTFAPRKVGRAIFVGGEARHMGLCQHVARVLRLPSQVADPLARVARSVVGDGVDLAQPQPGWALAMGMSLCPTDL